MTASRGLSADQAAKAIVAACVLLGVDPANAFEGGHAKGPGNGSAHAGRGARRLAAFAVRARLGVSPSVLGRVFAIHPNEVAPSQQRKYGVTSDQLLAVSEALGAIEGDDARARFVEPMSGVPTRPCPKPEARSPKPEARSPKPEARSREVRGVSAAVNPLLAERPRAVRYAAWFLDARWPLKTVANLFDVDPRELLDALDPAVTP